MAAKNKQSIAQIAPGKNRLGIPHHRLDSEVARDARLVALVDDDWRKDRLPKEDIAVPEQHDGDEEFNTTYTGLQYGVSREEMEEKWKELSLERIKK